MEYTNYLVYFNVKKSDVGFVDKVKAKTEQEASDKILKKYKKFKPCIKKIILY